VQECHHGAKNIVFLSASPKALWCSVFPECFAFPWRFGVLPAKRKHRLLTIRLRKVRTGPSCAGLTPPSMLPAWICTPCSTPPLRLAPGERHLDSHRPGPGNSPLASRGRFAPVLGWRCAQGIAPGPMRQGPLTPNYRGKSGDRSSTHGQEPGDLHTGVSVSPNWWWRRSPGWCSRRRRNWVRPDANAGGFGHTGRGNDAA